jgi:hypothetical protein
LERFANMNISKEKIMDHAIDALRYYVSEGGLKRFRKKENLMDMEKEVPKEIVVNGNKYVLSGGVTYSVTLRNVDYGLVIDEENDLPKFSMTKTRTGDSVYAYIDLYELGILKGHIEKFLKEHGGRV